MSGLITTITIATTTTLTLTPTADTATVSLKMSTTKRQLSDATEARLVVLTGSAILPRARWLEPVFLPSLHRGVAATASSPSIVAARSSLAQRLVLLVLRWLGAHIAPTKRGLERTKGST